MPYLGVSAAEQTRTTPRDLAAWPVALSQASRRKTSLARFASNFCRGYRDNYDAKCERRHHPDGNGTSPRFARFNGRRTGPRPRASAYSPVLRRPSVSRLGRCLC